MKRLFAAALISAAFFLSLNASVNAQTRTFSLTRGDMIAPAVASVDPTTGAVTYHGGLVAGQVNGIAGNTFTLSITFRSTGVIDATNGIYSGVVVSPFSSFAISESAGRKTVQTSGTIDTGNVTYRVDANGLAEIITVTGNLTVWEGKNKNRRAVAYGIVDYGTTTEGVGTINLF